MTCRDHGFTDARLREAVQLTEKHKDPNLVYGEMCDNWEAWYTIGQLREEVQPAKKKSDKFISTMDRDKFRPQRLRPWLTAVAAELKWEKHGEFWEKSGGTMSLHEQLMHSVLNWEPEKTGAIAVRINAFSLKNPAYDNLLLLVSNTNEIENAPAAFYE